MIKISLAIAPIIVYFMFQVAAIADEQKSSQIVLQAIDKVFKPTSIALQENTRALDAALKMDCWSSTARKTFKNTVAVFSEIEYYRLGVINQQNRAERLFFWPDRKATGQKQLRRLLQDPKRDLLDTQALAKKSVALQGLPALEAILFSKKADYNAKDCLVAQAIGGNINNIAAQIKQDWFAQQGIATQLSKGTKQSLYRSNTEAMAAILTLSESALISLSEKKLGLIIDGLKQWQSIPKSAPFWRSDMTLNHLGGNLLSIEHLLIATGIAKIAGVEATLKFEFRTANSMLDAAKNAFASAEIKTMANRLLALKLIIDGMQTTLAETISPALGVSTGFNSSDGD